MKFREEEALELAAQVADLAGTDVSSSREDRPLDERTTWGDTPEGSYRRALDEIALLVELRRQASEGIPPSAERSDETHWGPFELVERLGGGASGEVYKARDTHLGHHVALKLFHRLRMPAVDLDTLLVEGRQHALVKHPNVAVIHGADEYGGRIGIWMEYIDGATLQELVERDGSFGAAEAVNIGRELCAALAAVHQRGLTHGDIKAQNVMREKGGRIVLMDFSSSRPVRVEDEGAGLAGTPIYMAPELFDGGAPDFRSDIYALGVLLFYLVTGRHPYEGRSLRELKQALERGQPLLLADLRPDLPSELIQVIHKAIARSPDDRFQSAGELRAALHGSDGTRTIVRGPSESLEPQNDSRPESSTGTVSMFAGFGVAAGGAVFLTFLGYVVNSMFRISLQIPREFAAETLSDHFLTGVYATIPEAWDLARLTVLFVAAIGTVWVLAKLFGQWERIRGVTAGLSRRLEATEPLLLAAVFVALAGASLIAVNAFYWDVLDAMAQMSSAESITEVDVTALAAYNWPRHQNRTLVYCVFLLLCSLSSVLLYRHLRKRRAPGEAVNVVVIGTALLLLIAMVTVVAPWRLLWNNESRRVGFAEYPAYVVGAKEGEIFLYSPTNPTKSHHIVSEKDPRVDWGEEVVIADLFEHLDKE